MCEENMLKIVGNSLLIALLSDIVLINTSVLAISSETKFQKVVEVTEQNLLQQRNKGTREAQYLNQEANRVSRVLDLISEPLRSGGEDRLAQILPLQLHSSDDSPSFSPLTQDDLNSDGSNEPNLMEQVTSVSQLTDVQPTDWAFQALQSLVERYGCIKGYPNKTYRGNRALTRYEFAAGVNACLKRMNELIATSTNDLVRKEDLEALQKLQAQFSAEIAALRGRVDVVEASTSKLEQQQFSTTTKLSGNAVFALADVFGKDENRNHTVLQERVILNLLSSFTGKDSLTVGFVTGNVPTNVNAFNLSGVNLGGVLPVSTAEGTLSSQYSANFNNSLSVFAAEYRFPVGDRLQVALEGYFGTTYFIAPTLNPYLDSQDTSKGAISAFGERSPIYRQGGGTGIGLNYKLADQLTLTGVYLASLASANNPISGAGLFNGGYTALGQLTWNPTKSLGVAFTYVNTYFRPGEFGFNNNAGLSLTGTAVANTLAGQTGLSLISQPERSVAANSYGVEFSFQPSSKFAISGWFGTTYSRLIGQGEGEILYYALALAFPDFGKQGSVLGFVFGAEPYLTHFNGGNPQPFKTDIPFHIEAFYQYQLTSSIALTPGLIWLTAPNQNSSNASDVIATLRTTFTF
jgi:BMFP domain-containing protein YqiC